MRFQHGQSFYWLCLIIAIIFEVAGSGIMKFSSGTSWAVHGLLLMYLLLGLSYYSLAKAALGLPIGVAYAFWEGLGLVLVTLVSVFLLGESMTAKKACALGLMLGGVILVHRGTGHGSNDGSVCRDEGCCDEPDAPMIDGKYPASAGGEI